LKSFELCVQIALLPLPADPPIQDDQTSISFPRQSLNLGSGDSGFVSHPDRMDLASLNPFAHSKRV